MFGSWLDTIRPTLALDANETVVLPTALQVVPSAEVEPMTVLPVRASFSQAGNGRDAPAMKLVAPPVVDRVMNSTLPSGRTSRTTLTEPAASVSRSITPTFAYALVFCSAVTRATICPSPLNGWYT